MSTPKPSLLLVDDEQSVLDGLARNLRARFDVRTATSGGRGLELLEADPETAIVVSDMRMPGMNGAMFLEKSRLVAPDSVRILLTGQAEMDDAIAAINRGGIFRFLRKPCPPDLILATLSAATEQHRLVMAERQLLTQTLRGAVQALCDTLAIANPSVFGMATRVKRLSSELAEKLGIKETWPLEVAALVCQLGAITVPVDVYERRARHQPLLLAEEEMLDRVPQVTDQLLAPIPRLEPVRAIIHISRGESFSLAPVTGDEASTRIALCGNILRVARDFDAFEVGGDGPGAALERMRIVGAYDPRTLDALAELCGRERSVQDVALSNLREGMIIAADIKTSTGMLIIARGHEVTPSLIGHLKNFAGTLGRPVVAVYGGSGDMPQSDERNGQIR